MHRLLSLLAAGLFVAGAAQAGQEARPPKRWDWGFEGDRVNRAPTGFSFGRTGDGRMGRWVVWPHPDAPSQPNVLAQVDGDSVDFRFPMAVADDPRLSDVRLSVRCKPMAGRLEQSCGLVFRYQDGQNYYVARANALERNVRLYKVVEGRRQQLGDWRGAVTNGAWHVLQVEALGDAVAVSWDGQAVIRVSDRTTFQGPGQVGVWTKADSVVYFDDLRVESLED